MFTPPFLQSGDAIGIVAPSGVIDADKIDRGIKTLEKWGFKVVMAEHLLSKYYRFSSTDEERLMDLQAMLDAPEIKAIIAGRGGYGLVRIIDALSFTGFKNHPKWFIGFSDLTILHSYINQYLEIESIHGPMASHLDADFSSDDALNQLHSMLTGNPPSYHFATNSHSIPGVATGLLTGGNLSLIVSNIGTPTDINTEGKILFIEEVSEHHYHIDRMMRQLKRSGKLSRLAGMIIGDFTDPRDEPSDFGKTCTEIIAEVITGYDFPVLSGFPAGHIFDNRPLIMGRTTRIEINSESSNIFQ